jgi:hypothetical protein
VQPLLVYITGSGPSGSTLLDLLLNNSPFVQSVGEVHRLNVYSRTNMESCTCGRYVLECPFWLSAEEQLRRRVGAGRGESLLETHEMMLMPERVGRFGTFLQKTLLVLGSRFLYELVAPRVAPAHVAAARNSLQWYDAIRSVSRSPVVVDSTKDARRLKVLYFAQPQVLRVLYMVRDGRAVTASAIRRDGITMRKAATRWRHSQRRVQMVLRGIPRSQVLRPRYESLCRDAANTMKTICAFLGLPFDASMLELRKRKAHNIGGNPMRFRAEEGRIVLDERWRKQLSKEELRVFAQIAGRMNWQLGYLD